MIKLRMMHLVLVVFINIDILNIGRECNQNCRDCFADESVEQRTTLDEDFVLAESLLEDYEDKKIFIYPKEIATSPELIDLMVKNGQDYVLTNGKKNIDSILGDMSVRFSLYPNEKLQKFWKGNSSVEYVRIMQTIERLASKGKKIETFTIFSPETIDSLPEFYSNMNDLGVDRLNILRLIPVGKSRDAEDRYLMTPEGLKRLLEITDELKNGGTSIKFSSTYGPDFTQPKVWEYLRDGGETWVGDKKLCPAIDNGYVGISMQTKNLYWCFFQMSEGEPIGKLIGANLVFDDVPDFSKDTLMKNLRGICSIDNCEYQDKCLGGCRSAAYSIAKRNGEENPLYAGMDLCRTQARRNIK